METEFTSHAKFTFESIPDDIPSFEDAFDTASLKRFYSQHHGETASHCSVSDCLSDYKDLAASPSLLFRDEDIFVKRATTVQNSFSQLFCGSPETASTVSSKSVQNFSGYFNSLYFNPATEKKPAVKKPFEIIRSTPVKQLPMMKIAFKGVDLFGGQRDRILSESTVDMETEEMTGFERRLRSKTVFKVIRDSTTPKVAPKRKTSTQIKESLQVKKTKSASPKMVVQEIPLERTNTNPTSPSNQEPAVTADRMSLMHLLDMLNQKSYPQQQVMNGFQTAIKGKNH